MANALDSTFLLGGNKTSNKSPIIPVSQTSPYYPTTNISNTSNKSGLISSKTQTSPYYSTTNTVSSKLPSSIKTSSSLQTSPYYTASSSKNNTSASNNKITSNTISGTVQSLSNKVTNGIPLSTAASNKNNASNAEKITGSASGTTVIKNTGATPSTDTPTTVVNTPSNNYTDDYGDYVYYGGGGGSYGGGSSSNSSLFDMINEWYEAQKQATINQIQHAMDEAVADYQKSIDGLDESYQPLRNQSEVERYKSEQALKEQLANGGNTYSGMGRQETLNLQNAYSNAITDINNQQQNELEELERYIQNTKAEGEFQKANAGLTYDANQLQSMIDQANLDREFAWNQYLQQYTEQQNSLAYDWQKYLQDYQEKKDAISGVTSGSTHTVSQAKNWLSNSLVTGSIYDGFDSDLEKYYKNYGAYPTNDMIDEFVKQVNDYSGIYTKTDIESLLNAWYNLGRLNDAEAAIIGLMYNVSI